MDHAPRLDTLPLELLDYVLEFLPEADAYFMRLASRAFVARAERRVNPASREWSPTMNPTLCTTS